MYYAPQGYEYNQQYAQIAPHAEDAETKRRRSSKGNWAEEEDGILKQAYDQYPKQWAKIATFLPGRSNQQCKQRWNYVLNTDIKSGPWTKEEDVLLQHGFQQYGKQWAKISEMIPGRTNIQCRNRYKDVLDPTIKSVPWAHEEDVALCQAVKECGSQWSRISLMIHGRTALQCRDRYVRKFSRKN
jgi:hypothetical protein